MSFDEAAALSGSGLTNGDSNNGFSPTSDGELSPPTTAVVVTRGVAIREIRVEKLPLFTPHGDEIAWNAPVKVCVGSQTIGVDDFDLVTRMKWIISHERTNSPDRCRCLWMGKACQITAADLALLNVHQGGVNGSADHGLILSGDTMFSFVRPLVSREFESYGPIKPHIVYDHLPD